MNKCTFHGRLGTDPEIRVAGDSKVATFSFAVSKKYKDRNGQQQEKTTWLRIVAWKGKADVAERFFKKGTELVIETEVDVRSWDDQNGQKKYSTEFILRDFDFCGSRNSGNSSNADTDTNFASDSSQYQGGGNNPPPREDDLPF